MKRIEEQTYYEILEVGPSASVKEVQRAYDHAKETFHSDSMAVYSLFSDEEITKIQSAIEEAYRVLMDEALRRSYDQPHPLTPSGMKWDRSSETLEIAREKKEPPSSISPLTDEKEGTFRGKTLKHIRERMGIDLNTISMETKISMRTLEWIEEEVFEKLPAMVYLKGFLKGYALFLGLDPLRVIEGYLQSMSAEKKRPSP